MSATVETLILVFLLVLAGSAMLIWTKRAPKTRGVARVWQLAWGSLALGMLVAAVTFSEPATLPAPFSSRPI